MSSLERAFLPGLLALALLGGGLRWLALDQTFPWQPSGDELYYLGTAINVAEGRGYFFNARQRALRPPGLTAVLVPFVPTDPERVLHLERLVPRLAAIDPAAPDPELVDLMRPLVRAQVLLGTLLLLSTAWLGRALFDARVGLIAGLLAAVQPSLVVFSHYLFSETLFALLWTSALALTLRATSARSIPRTLGAGVVFGAATLTREIAAPIAAVCGLWLVAVATPGERRPALLRAALLVLCVALVVAPWTARNWTVFERLVPLSTVGWLAAGEGNTLEHPDWLKAAGPERRRFKNHFFAIGDELERVEYARAYTFERVREEQPGWLPKKLVRNLGLLWSPNDTLFERIGKGSYGEVSTGTVRALFLAHLVLYTGLVVLAVLGIAAAPFDRRLLGVMLLGTVCALHVLLNATPRYRVPWLPLLSVYAAYAVVAGRQLFAPDARRRLAAALLALALLAGVVATRFPAEAASIWSHGG